MSTTASCRPARRVESIRAWCLSRRTDSGAVWLEQVARDRKRRNSKGGGRMRSQCMAAAVFAVLATGASAVVTAQEAAEAGSSPSGQLQEVIVTAERRTTDVQRSANSISVLGGAEMLAEGSNSLAQILEDVPGIQGGATPGLGA